MKTARSSIYCPSRFTHKVGESLVVEVELTENPYDLPAETLYEMAARINKKRSFLFVSKVLGKHIPTRPEIPLIASALLASIYYEGKTGKQAHESVQLIEALKDGSIVKTQAAYSVVKDLNYSLGEPVVFIGFAETATALGHGVFESFSDADYIHSTRDLLLNEDVTLYFEEEHSHATDQRCYAPEHLLNNTKPICLVDDEITTGKTALNIIASIQRRYPRKEYSVLSVLDWRSEEDRRLLTEFEVEHGVTIHTYSLMSGKIQVVGTPSFDETEVHSEKKSAEETKVNRISLSSVPTDFPHHLHVSVDSLGIENKSPFSAITGRFGIHSDSKKEVEAFCERAGLYLQSYRKGKKTLCLGTGEFMYLPMKIALYMGTEVLYHSTTRSPIYPINREGYPIKNRFSFKSPDDPKVMNYTYNVTEQNYDEVFLFFERPIDDERLQPMLEQFSGIPVIHIVDFT
ncbi:phosphoribosyltransferase family protein [Sporosarcina siberiensis]|uniref:Phosphoribosyltransferase family protein n=1 Tax=Sporosarcina siberiensis TaxID=1365606 RepID=A0ABW4SLI1_9BACL